jgi:hypothetical protein
MEFAPEEWGVFPAEEFNTAAPRASGQLYMELMIQVRPNGRMLDHCRLGLGGSSVVDARFELARLFSFPAASRWAVRYQVWPKDIDLRRNMASTGWKDLTTMVASHDAVVIDRDSGEPVASEIVLDAIKASGSGASVRFAVIVGEDQSVHLQLQGLPAAANVLMGKPAFRG